MKCLLLWGQIEVLVALGANTVKLTDFGVDNGHEDSTDYATECFKMNRKDQKRRWAGLLAGGFLAVSCFASTGCQVDVAGQTLPSPYYMSDDVQYFPAGPEFKLSNEAAAMEAYAAETAAEEAP